MPSGGEVSDGGWGGRGAGEGYLEDLETGPAHCGVVGVVRFYIALHPDNHPLRIYP